MAVAAAILAFIGSIDSWDAIDWFNAIRAGLIGGFSTLAALLFLIPLWRMLVAPHHIWASDQGRIQALSAERDELETYYRSEETRRKGLEQQLSEKQLENINLRTANHKLAEDCQRLASDLESRRSIELIPRSIQEYDSINFLPATIKKITLNAGDEPDSPAAESSPADERKITVVWGRLTDIIVINNDESPTTIARMWLRVNDPVTGKEIAPLAEKEIGAASEDDRMEPREKFTDGIIAGREKTTVSLEFRSLYPGSFSQLSSDEKAKMVSLCVTATGCGTKCFPLGREFFFDGR